ncbi:MAG: OmpH family outer membrane protein [Desulfovibrio sp.]|jgi:Skp family chaperone for outer membrane proteins|nr:OmpH family outer membrane protein [Desulfovibrio sp.]
MRKIFCLATAFLLCAAPDAGAAELSVAVFDLQKVAAACDAVQDARAAIDSKYGAQKMLLEKDRAALEKKMEGFQAKKPTPKQQEDFAKEQREYSERAQAFMRLLQADELRVRQDIDSILNQAAENLAKRKGYSLVMDIASIPYYDSNLDVTGDMLAEANVVFKKIKDEMLKSGPPQNAPAATNATAPAPRNATAPGTARPGGTSPRPGTGK